MLPMCPNGLGSFYKNVLAPSRLSTTPKNATQKSCNAALTGQIQCVEEEGVQS